MAFRRVLGFLACLAFGLVGVGAVVGSGSGRSVFSYLRGPVRVWVVPYPTHDGKSRQIYLDLPAWYGRQLHPPLPLVISPHGRQALATANSALWGPLPARDWFAVANPEGQGRVLANESWGYSGQIADLARIPTVLGHALPWLRITPHQVYAIGGSMGGQEALLLLAKHPGLLAGVVAFDAPTDLALRYKAIARLRNGAFLQRLMRKEVGGTPGAVPRRYVDRSPLHFAARIARAGVPIELWWSRRDQVVINQSTQSGRLFRAIRQLNPHGHFREVVGAWSHMAEMNWREDALRAALRWLGIHPPRRISLTQAVCARPAPGRWGYGWPVKPFDRPHPVRGNFGDPRTVFYDDLGEGGLVGPGEFSFHDGVDIAARLRTPVYPVVSGTVKVDNADTVEVRTSDDRRFLYMHLRLAVHNGAQVRADHTVLGYIKRPWWHVHLTEIDPIPVDGLPDSGYEVVNPLQHLSPYFEQTAPRLGLIGARNQVGQPVSLNYLHGRIWLIATAYTYPATQVNGAWHHMPVSAATLRWRLLTATGATAIRWHTTFDTRHTIPPKQDFWHIYARGSYQNFPQLGNHYYYRRPGRYLYTLTPTTLNTQPLPNGRYTLTLQTSDICGNTTIVTAPIRIQRNPG